MTQTIDALLYKSMIMSGAALLEQNKQHINDLNVFPVPDGDTGTNMSLTLNSGVTALKNGSFQTVGEQADAVAAALLRGARGNSGVILSLLFRGISKDGNGGGSGYFHISAICRGCAGSVEWPAEIL